MCSMTTINAEAAAPSRTFLAEEEGGVPRFRRCLSQLGLEGELVTQAQDVNTGIRRLVSYFVLNYFHISHREFI